MPDEPALLAIDGGTPARSAPWPAVAPSEPADDADPVAGFEAALAERLELPAAAVVMCADGAAAYRAALGIVPVGERNEVIVPALLEREAAEAARGVGWAVVPGEVDADTAALSVRGIARAMGERTALAVVRHPWGHPAVMTELHRLASERGVVLVEDVSGALGASFRGAAAGRLGAVAVFTGREGDPITRGACIVAADLDAAARLRAEASPAPHDDARVALAELRDLDAALEHRRHLAWELTFRLRGMRGVTPLPHGRWIRHAYARYVVRLRGLVWKRSLEDTLAALRAEGIPCEAACDAPLHLDAEIVGALPGDVRVGEDVFPIAARLPGELIALSLAGDLTSKDMDDVADALRKIEARSL
ncbi:MAG: DegT/DnrJ/EryC1/StrS family aminotransferase [Dehalococcoidia bacterium]